MEWGGRDAEIAVDLMTGVKHSKHLRSNLNLTLLCFMTEYIGNTVNIGDDDLLDKTIAAEVDS
jgi:hypothetical protein